MSFTPTEIAAEIKTFPEFTISYKPDFRQKIETAGLLVLMTTKPERLGWKHEFDLESMTVDMLEHLK
jgi:hypothetical protein